MQDKELIATDPAPGNDTFRTRLLPLFVQTCRLLWPNKRAGLRRTNRCVGAVFGRLPAIEQKQTPHGSRRLVR